LRYPAGTTADSFNWLRAIGPQTRRQPNEPYGMQDGVLSKVCCTLDGPAASTVGPDEFGRLLDQTGAVGDIIVNFVTGTAQEAADFVAYMTVPPRAHPSHNPKEASYWAALRARNGHRLAYRVPYWEVGNEQYSAGQLGWRSGRVISVGRHRTYCPAASAPVCLYAFGGTTAFVDQRVGVFADDRSTRSRSTGAAHQRFFVYFPPVVARSYVVYIAGRAWRPIASLASAGPNAQVYQFSPDTGEISFGNGEHGAIPPRRAEIRASYYSGPHGGFVQFYDAMKEMNHRIRVCETEDSNTVFLRAMGSTYPYDCVELHKYAHPTDLRAPILRYEENLIYAPIGQGVSVSRLQTAVRRYSGKNVPLLLSEYGQLVAAIPVADPEFNLSLYEGLLVASQLRQWIDHNLPVAEKYLLNSAPFLHNRSFQLAINPVGLSVDNAMIAGPGPPFVMEPTGSALALMSRLAGARRLGSTVVGGPSIIPAPGLRVPVLQTLAASSRGCLDILVINVSPTASVRARVQLGYSTAPSNMTVSVLDGPSTTAYNTFSRPRLVKVATRVTRVRGRNLTWTFPAHSLTLLQLGLDRDKASPARHIAVHIGRRWAHIGRRWA
jgi:alpha-N-arabinofuranosidase